MSATHWGQTTSDKYEVVQTNNIDYAGNTIAFLIPALDCTVEKCIKEYVPFFQLDNYQVTATLQTQANDLIALAPRAVVLFRTGTGQQFSHISTILNVIHRLQSVGVRAVYYIDDFLWFANHRTPLQIAHNCDAVIVSTHALRDFLLKLDTYDKPVIHVPTHIDIATIDRLPKHPYIGNIKDKFKIFISSSNQLGIPLLLEIMQIANSQLADFEDVQWIVSAAGVAQVRALTNEFRKLHKAYFDWMPLTEYYSICKSVDLILNLAQPNDIAPFALPEHRQIWLDSKSAVKYTLAGACRIPVISSPMAAYVDAITQDHTGYIATTAQEFVDKILYLKRNPNIAAAVGQAARQDVEANFHIAKRYPLYRDAIIGTLPDDDPHVAIPKRPTPVTSPEDPLSTARLTLRPLAAEDIEMVRQWRNTYRHEFFDTTEITPEMQQAWYQRYLTTTTTDKMFIITLRDGTPIGQLALYDISATNRTAKFGRFLILSEYRGQGYATEAMRSILKYAFKVLQLAKIKLEVYVDNLEAIAVYTKVGFKPPARPIMILEKDNTEDV